MARVKLSLGRLSVYPDSDRQLFRVDNGIKIPLVGFDYNREHCKREILSAVQGNPRLRTDAAGLFLEEDLRARKQEFFEAPRRPLAAEEFVPMDPEAASFADAKEYTWEVRTPQGGAEMHASLNGVTEAPDVSESANFQNEPIVNAIISYGWTVEDELYGGRTGYNFGMRRAALARDAIALAFDKFLLTGGTFDGAAFTGLFNKNDTSETGETGDWHTAPGTTTVAEVKADFKLLFDAWRNAAYVAGASGIDAPDTVAMSDRIESMLRHTMVDATTRTSILDELKRDYPEITSWLPHRDLRDIKSSKDRILMYKKDPRVIAAAVPVAYQERPIMQTPFGQKVYAFGRIAPVALHDGRLLKVLDIAMH
jgi:hypothetical protein